MYLYSDVWALFSWKCCSIETWRTGYEKELWKTYVVSMPSAVIIIILGQTLSNRIVWGSPQRRLGEKCCSKLQSLWFEGNLRVKNNNLVLFGCNIKFHIRGYFITNHNLVHLWPPVKSGGLQDYSIPFWSIDPKTCNKHNS